MFKVFGMKGKPQYGTAKGFRPKVKAACQSLLRNMRHKGKRGTWSSYTVLGFYTSTYVIFKFGQSYSIIMTPIASQKFQLIYVQSAYYTPTVAYP